MFSSGGYGRFGGHGRGRGGYSAARQGGQGWLSKPKVPRAPSPSLGLVLTTILYNELNEDQEPPSNAKITGVEDVASYNWVKANEPTIMIPGMPPKWTPSATSTQLAEDDPNGTYYRDPNAAYFPSYPVEPAVRSIFEANPEFHPTEINIFGCGSTLGNLLRFACRVDTEKPFRFLVEVVGETVFFIRRENSPKEVIADIRGYGHSFPEAYTTWDADVKGSKTHQRIVRYQLGDLNTVIRFEADGYFVDKIPTKGTETSPSNQTPDEDFLVSALAGNTINAKTHKDSDTLKLTRGQRSVPQSAVFDLKTRSIKKKYLDTTVKDQLPRLWIRQIPSFILAYHERGLFRPEEVTVHNVKTAVVKWESDNKQDLRKLILLIKKIADFVKNTPGQKLEVRYQDGIGLELREQGEGVTSVLPDDLAARWADQGQRGESIDAGVALDDKIDDGSGFDDGFDEDQDDWGVEAEDFTACSADSCGYCGHCSY